MNQFVHLLFILLSITPSTSQSFGQANSGTIAGTVTDVTGKALFNVNIVLLGTTLGAATDETGKYRIDHVKPGEYTLKFMCIGYRTELKNNILIKAGQTIQLDVKLEEKVLSMPGIEVTSGSFLISKNQPIQMKEIYREKISSLPATLDDINRVLQIMPGVSFSHDLSAHFHVRGGEQSENLILLDGMEIFDPYHLKNIGGATGIMNLDLIEKVAILTGGFPAKYGDKLSSVVVVENRIGNQQKISGSLGIGATGSELVLEVPIPRGSGLLSFRKSFLKEAVKFLNPTEHAFVPSFYDAQAKIFLEADKDNQFITHFLYSHDESHLENWPDDSGLYSKYGNCYYGLVWKRIFNPTLLSELIISRGENFRDNRVGTEKAEELNLKESVLNWNLDLHPHRNHNLELGITYKHIQYNYQINPDTLSKYQQNIEELIESYFGDANVITTTYKIASYLQGRSEIFESLVATAGIRYDYFDYNQDQQWSPRVGLAYSLTDKTTIRTAWGLYYQAPTYTQLTSIKGAATNPKAEKAVHSILGIEHAFNNSLNFRLEGYVKTLTRMIGHYFEAPEPPSPPIIKYGNPYTGYSKGIELFLTGKIVPPLSIWFTYAYSISKIEAAFVNWENETVEKKLVPRFTDQPHNLSFFLSYQLPRDWELNIKWRYLSGIPYTPQYPAWDSSEKPIWIEKEAYSARYPAYHRLDFRIGKRFEIKKFDVSTYFEIKNLYNRKNISYYGYRIEDGRHHLKIFYALPFLPSLEFNLNF